MYINTRVDLPGPILLFVSFHKSVSWLVEIRMSKRVCERLNDAGCNWDTVRVYEDMSVRILKEKTTAAYFCLFLSFWSNAITKKSTNFSGIKIQILRKRWQLPTTIHGLWWWSSGQCVRRLLWRSEFESRWSLQFLLCKNCLKRTKINEKEAKKGSTFKSIKSYT